MSDTSELYFRGELAPKARSTSFADELAALPNDFLQSAYKAAIEHPVEGMTQLCGFITNATYGKFEAPKLTQANDAVAFGSMRWHVQQFGSAVGTILPYMLCRGITSKLSKIELVKTAATGILMEGIARPVYAHEGDFAKARLVNAVTGSLTFSTLHFLPSKLKARDEHLHGINQPWLVNSFASDLRRHVASGAIAGTVDAESRSLLSGHGLARPDELIQSAYGYALMSGSMRAATEVMPSIRHGHKISDVVELNPRLSKRAKLDPIAKELLMDYGDTRLTRAQIRSSKDIYDLFVHAKDSGAAEMKFRLMHQQKSEISNSKKPARDYTIDQLFGSLHKKQNASQTVADLLRSDDLNGEYCFHNHPTNSYAQAFEPLNWKSKALLGIGGDSIAIELSDSSVLKIFTRSLEDGQGQRFYDMPIQESGSLNTVKYLIQPKAAVCVPTKFADRFANHMKKIGYEFDDNNPEQLGLYDGRIVLLDYFSVLTKAAADAKRNAYFQRLLNAIETGRQTH